MRAGAVVLRCRRTCTAWVCIREKRVVVVRGGVA